MGLIKDIKDIEQDLWYLDDKRMFEELERIFQEYMNGKAKLDELEIELGVNNKYKTITIELDLKSYIKKSSAFMSVTASHLYIFRGFFEKLGLINKPSVPHI